MKKINSILIYLAWILFIAFWIFTIYSYYIFPESIPIHFNLKGEVDRYGHKSTNFLLLAINSFVFVVFTFAKKIPAKFAHLKNQIPHDEPQESLELLDYQVSHFLESKNHLQTDKETY